MEIKNRSVKLSSFCLRITKTSSSNNSVSPKTERKRGRKRKERRQWVT